MKLIVILDSKVKGALPLANHLKEVDESNPISIEKALPKGTEVTVKVVKLKDRNNRLRITLTTKFSVLSLLFLPYF